MTKILDRPSMRALFTALLLSFLVACGTVAPDVPTYDPTMEEAETPDEAPRSPEPAGDAPVAEPTTDATPTGDDAAPDGATAPDHEDAAAESPDGDPATEEEFEPLDPNLFTDDFLASLSDVWPESGARGGWYVHWTGGGRVEVVPADAGAAMELRSSPTPVPDEWGDTASTLVTSVHRSSGDVEVRARMRTLEQLRDGARGTPNAWEVAWLAWNHQSVDGIQSFYYLTLKPNGWELGKVDQAVFTETGGQRYLATGASPSFPVGEAWRDVRIVQEGGRIRAWADGRLLADVVDGPGSGGLPAWGTPGERVLTSGAVGLYHEDARVQFTDVSVRSVPGDATDLLAGR